MTRNGSRSHTASVLISAVATVLVVVTSAGAYDAQVGWSTVAGASGYKVHVGLNNAAFAASVSVGNPAADGDGVIRVVINDLPLGPDLRFAVSAHDSTGQEGSRSNEITLAYADVARLIDSDGDGLKDADEDKNLNGVVDFGETDPADADSDNDGLTDGDEVKTHGTNPLDADSDDDGISDSQEVTAGTNPKDPSSGPLCGNGRVEGTEQCDDGNSNNDDGCLSSCRNAECIPGQGGCSDGNPCTTDACQEGRCVSTNNTNSCNDGVACTASDRCSNGTCAGVDSCSGGSVCLLETGQCEAKKTLKGRWIPAATYPATTFRGRMITGVEFTAGTDADPVADSLSPLLVFADSTINSFTPGSSGDETIYTVNVPTAGTWYLWGRFYYPGLTSSANSFFVRIDDGAASAFGNKQDMFRKWHWDGDGDLQSGPGQALDLGWLAAGSHRLIVEKREASGPDSPRLDMIFLTSESAAVPTDEDALLALAVCPQGVCDGDESAHLCGDATGDGRLSVVDAWSILTASVANARACGLAVCDVDGNDVINSTDALHALRGAVGVGLYDLRCKPAVGFDLAAASEVTAVDFTVNYSLAGVSFDVGGATPVCMPALPRATRGLTVTDDATAEKLRVRLDLEEPLSGDMRVVECRFSTGSSLPIPALFAVTVNDYSRVGGRSTTTVPHVAPTVVLP